jgi:crotonobetainyl-CoA:carnitine CoA-transferase CaiB-like acyl-CoA transferase
VVLRSRKEQEVGHRRPEVARGQDLVKSLVAKSDVVVENFRPGVLERCKLGWDDLRAVKPDLVMLRISGFGQTGPYSQRPGFGKIGESFSGATTLTGHRDEAPVHPGWSAADLTVGLTGAFSVMLALYALRESGQRGQMIDLALYEPLFRMIEWQIPLYEQTGWVPRRNGAKFPFGNAFLTNICSTTDDRSVVVSCANLATLGRLIKLLAAEGRVPATLEALDDIVRLEVELEAWISGNDYATVMARLREFDVPSELVYTAADLYTDEHIRARGSLVSVKHPDLGEITMPAPIPRFSTFHGEVKWAGPRLGEHVDDVLGGLLGMTVDEIAELRRKGVV